jgi:hypothetical protein
MHTGPLFNSPKRVALSYRSMREACVRSKRERNNQSSSFKALSDAGTYQTCAPIAFYTVQYSEYCTVELHTHPFQRRFLDRQRTKYRIDRIVGEN